jgi:uncharacterized protein
MIAFIALGLFIGVVMGLTGAGGGVLAVPALVSLMGWSMQQAAPVALVAVACGAVIGTIEGLQRGLVRYRAALLMAAAGVPFTVLGQSLAQRAPEVWLKAVFSAVLILVAFRIFNQSGNALNDEAQAGGKLHAVARIDPDTHRFVWTWPTAFLLSGMGMITGFAAGLLGVGGGFILVPLLARFTPLTMHSIVASSLMVMSLVSLVGVANALHQGLNLPLQATSTFAVATIVGMLIGRSVVNKLPAQTVQRSFAVMMLAVAAMMIVKLVL